MPSIVQLSALAIVVFILFIAAALYLMYEIGRLVGEKTTADKFPDAKKAAVRRSRSVLGGMFAEQLAPYLPNFPFSPTEAKFIGAPIDFLVFKGMDEQRIEEVIFVEVKSGAARLTTMSTASKTRLKISVSAGTSTTSPLPSRTPTTWPHQPTSNEKPRQLARFRPGFPFDVSGIVEIPSPNQNAITI
jgi:Endonuclease related to archaeal Holliday junction resolvase